MSRIKCIECDAFYDDASPTCPHCGCLTRYSARNREELYNDETNIEAYNRLYSHNCYPHAPRPASKRTRSTSSARGASPIPSRQKPTGSPAVATPQAVFALIFLILFIFVMIILSVVFTVLGTALPTAPSLSSLISPYLL